jgi:hypothetical protein
MFNNSRHAFRADVGSIHPILVNTHTRITFPLVTLGANNKKKKIQTSIVFEYQSF